jgi:hypothetical protein
MKVKLFMACVAGATLMFATAADARSPLLAKFRLVQNPPTPAPALAPTPMGTPAPMGTTVAPGGEPILAQGNAIPLFNCVRYKDECNIAPCAVPQIVMVKDPCFVCDPCNPCATAGCVAVKICVPPCSTCPPNVCCRNDGEYVRYDYGKYRVEIVSRRGVVTVDYDD